MLLQCILGSILLLPNFNLQSAKGPDTSGEKYRYSRVAGDKHVPECTFHIKRTKKGWSITSVTQRGQARMTVFSGYDADGQLHTAKAVYTKGKAVQPTRVDIKNGKAIIWGKEKIIAEFAVPKGTIVTSAPDWTDTFMLCRLYDRKRQGKQEFPALWIHPTKKPLRLTFSIERKDSVFIEHKSKKMKLGRYAIRIRNNSAYVAWADENGRMIRLIPAGAKSATAGLTLQGFEGSVGKLKVTR